MFERYTEKARRVIFFARYEASQLGAPSITPEHLLLGILRDDKNLLSRVSGTPAKLVLEELRRELETRLPPSEKISTAVELPLADGAKRVLAYAHEEAEQLRHRHIGTEHLLLGLLREERSVAAEILRERGLSLVSVREAVSAGEGQAAARSERQPARRWIDEIRLYGQRLLGLADDLSREAEQGMLETEKQSAAGQGGKAVAKGGRQKVVLGIERLAAGEGVADLRGARVGLVCNQASVNHELRHAADLLWENRQLKLTTLFGPQHGIRGDVQDNMVETPHTRDAETGLPVYSLYSETREPTEEMLADVDAIVCDLQDVGCRIYTFIYTLANCMRAARRLGKKVYVCDRPNPLGGVQLAGNLLEPEYASFVGQFPLPTRHGMTIGELAQMFRGHWKIDCELEVIRMEGWERELWFDETDVPWVMPSPNMPTLDAATVFPGTVHVEGTQLSEGRGTTRPFELVGAPYIDASEYARRLASYGFAGVHFRAANFQPTFQKHAGRTCGGVQIHVTDRESFEPVVAGIATVKVAYELYRDEFRWKEPPYEYVYDKNPFDVIAGTASLRQAFERGDSLEEIEATWREGLERFRAERAPYLLY